MSKTPHYLFPADYMADPSANVFNGKLYVYPSHDWESGIEENDNGDHFNMRDYHVFRIDDPDNGEAVDCGLLFSTDDIPWAGRQLWDNDVVEKNGKYYLVFCMKDKTDVFHLGVLSLTVRRVLSQYSLTRYAARTASTHASSRTMTVRSTAISAASGADSYSVTTATASILRTLISLRARRRRSLRAWQR